MGSQNLSQSEIDSLFDDGEIDEIFEQLEVVEKEKVKRQKARNQILANKRNPVKLDRTKFKVEPRPDSEIDYICATCNYRCTKISIFSSKKEEYGVYCRSCKSTWRLLKT